MSPSRFERGQVLVLVILALAGLMGFAALVVDGGHLYSERRRAQSAADAAALAAASAGSREKSDTDIASIVSSQAQANGFTNAGSTVVTYNHPPVSGPYVGKSEYYQVFITQEIAPIFSQFVFQGNQAVTVEAVARARPVSPLTGDNALLALASCGCDGKNAIDFDGDAALIIHGGNIYSNRDGVKKGAAGQIYVYADKDPTITTQGDIVTVGKWDNDTNVHANFVKGTEVINLDNVPKPYCPASNETINGVNYYVWNGNTLAGDLAAMNKAAGKPVESELPSGIHCITGTLDLTGSYKELTGTDVLLVLLNGGIKTKGNAYINISRASDLMDKDGNQWGGMVIYAPASNKSEWDIGGNSKTVFNGTLLAPGSTCDIGGTPSNTDNHAAFVCYNFKIHGTADVKITYDPKENWQWFPALSQSQ